MLLSQPIQRTTRKSMPVPVNFDSVSLDGLLSDWVGALREFSVEAIAVRGQLAAALGAAEEARQQAQAARRDAAALLEASDIERDRLRVDLDTMRAALRQAQDAAEALRQAEAARKARGLMARLRAAWRRE